MKRLGIGIALTLTLVALFSPLNTADAGPAPWPKCGDYTLVSDGEYSSANLTIVYGMDGPEEVIFIDSYNGWKFYHFDFLLSSGSTASANFPDGQTSDTAYLDPATVVSITIELQKDCTSLSKCKVTNSYVYTLLGNYPCNLVSAEYPIPARFLDRQYTGPLCQLPGMEHQWDGEYVVNKIKSCGGTLMGGQYFDTSLPSLP